MAVRKKKIRRIQRIREATRRLAAAKRELALARAVLAGATKPGDPDCLVAPEWAWAQRLLEKRRGRLMRKKGVVGCSLGFRHKDGVQTDEPCVTVFVRRKWSGKTLRKWGRSKIPRYFRVGKRRIVVDVVALGRIKRQLEVGASLGPDAPPLKGTLGAFATDLVSADTLALTAMHVSGVSEFPVPGQPPVHFGVPSRRDQLHPRLLGTLLRGTMQGIDACKIGVLTPSIVQPVIPEIGKIRGWRPTTYPGDKGTPVRLFGATSGFQKGLIINPAVPIPEEQLDVAIIVDIFTQDGDSGCALVDPANLILGFLVGQASGGFRVFTPASLVLARLSCEMMVF